VSEKPDGKYVEDNAKFEGIFFNVNIYFRLRICAIEQCTVERKSDRNGKKKSEATSGP